jgi:hypothetical protein
VGRAETKRFVQRMRKSGRRIMEVMISIIGGNAEVVETLLR